MGIEDLLNSVSKQIVTTSDDALWGVDSFDPAETIVPQEKISLFEYVVKHEKRRPLSSVDVSRSPPRARY